LKDTLTVQERKFFNAYLDNGGVLADAAKKAGYKCKDRHSYRETGRMTLKRIAPTLDDIMECMGITDALVMKKIMEGMEATDVKVATMKGKITHVKSFADFGTRHRYIDTVARIKEMGGMNKSKQELTGKDGEPVMGEIGDALREMVGAIMGKG
jgi:phage terminase small subunit